MNVKFFKKNLIDSESSKFIFLDQDESVEDTEELILAFKEILEKLSTSNPID